MKSTAVVLNEPRHLALAGLTLVEPGPADLVVDVRWSGISTGTERLLYEGRMPMFPGMGYPLVPGYEAVGQVREAGQASGHQAGDWVFVPGAHCFTEARCLFGASASTLVVKGERSVTVDRSLGERAVLLALAATAYHAVSGGGKRDPIVPPDLIVGHGVMGRLLARMTVLAGYPPPTVWEIEPSRSTDARGYPVVRPEDDDRRDYRAIYDVSGDSQVLDRLIPRLAPGGEVVLAGFYSQPLVFAFAPAFMREASIRCAAEWKPADMLAVGELAQQGTLPLDGLITHTERATQAHSAYATAFADSHCLKMVLDWSAAA